MSEQEPDAIAAVKAKIFAKKKKRPVEPPTTATEASISEDIGATMMGATPRMSTTAVAVKAKTSVDEASDITEDGYFDFAEDFQSKIAALSLRDDNFVRRHDGLIKPHHFENHAEAILVGLSQNHYDSYGILPEGPIWAEILKEARTSRIIRDDTMYRDVIAKLKKLRRANISNVDFVLDKIAHFSKRQEMMKAIYRSIELAQKGDFDAIEQQFSKAFDIGVARNYEELDYWGNIEERTQRRIDKASGLIKPVGIPTGVKKIDQLLYHKGLGRKELSVIMGGAKKGKSMGLGELGARFSLQGYNVLYATLEVSLDIIADRLDANITKTEMGNLEDSLHSVKSTVQEKAESAGKFKIVEFPSGQLSCKELKRTIESYRSKGIKFDVIIVDYADIMAPDIYTQNEIENSKQIWLGLRAIAQIENAAMITATQTNRT
ncbi:MAG: DnaB-like helicase C-terminal domain-containing protein, partial [Vibrio splendidus]